MRQKKFPYYRLFLDIEDRDVIIIGGGVVCERKAETMMKYGARVTVVAPHFTDAIQQWARSGAIQIRKKSYDSGDLDGASIVIASTDDEAVNTQIAADCRKRKIPVNVVDVTHLCAFIVPAIVEQGSIQLAVSTGGKSPALARTLKEDLQKFVGPEYAEINDLLGTLRPSAKKVLPTDTDRKRFFDGIIASGVVDMLRRGKRRQAYETIARVPRRGGGERAAARGAPMNDRGAVALIIAVWLLATLVWLRPGITRPDGVAYYAYLPSTYFDHDLVLFNEWQHFGMLPDGMVASEGVTPNGHLADHWTAGSAVVWYPGFIAADVARTFVPSLQRFPRDGTSLPYNAGAVAAALCGLAVLLADTPKRAAFVSRGRRRYAVAIVRHLAHVVRTREALMAHAVAPPCAMVVRRRCADRRRRGGGLALRSGRKTRPSSSSRS